MGPCPPGPVSTSPPRLYYALVGQNGPGRTNSRKISALGSRGSGLKMFMALNETPMSPD